MKVQVRILMFAVLLLQGCSEPDTTVKTAQSRPVKLISPEHSQSIVEYSLPAVIEATHSRELSFQVGGKIETLAVKEGDEVKKGQVIAGLNRRQFDNRYRASMASLKAIESQFSRAEKLLTTNAIAQSQYDELQANLAQAQAEYDIAKKEREDATLLSPFDGVIAITYLEAQQAVAPGQKIVTLDTFGDAEAVINIPANLVALEQQYEVIDVHVYLDVSPEIPLQASLVEVSTSADRRSQTFEARYHFTPPRNLTILPGMSATLVARADYGNNKSNGLLLPTSTVMQQGAQHFVWVFNSDSSVVNKRFVTLLPSVGDNVVISEGLTLADQVVSIGGAYLFEGMSVRAL